MDRTREELAGQFLDGYRSAIGWGPELEAEYRTWEAYSFLGAAQYYLGTAKRMVAAAESV